MPVGQPTNGGLYEDGGYQRVMKQYDYYGLEIRSGWLDGTGRGYGRVRHTRFHVQTAPKIY